jgi:hypothetical protein
MASGSPQLREVKNEGKSMVETMKSGSWTQEVCFGANAAADLPAVWRVSVCAKQRAD